MEIAEYLIRIDMNCLFFNQFLSSDEDYSNYNSIDCSQFKYKKEVKKVRLTVEKIN